jgi:signal recognition particle subunit SRP54
MDMAAAETELKRSEAIINSMTHQERDNAAIINGSRRRRIADGSGVSVAEVNKFLKQFQQTKKMMKHVVRFAGKGGMPGSGSMPGMT